MKHSEFIKILGLCVALAIALAVLLFLLALNWRITLWILVGGVLATKYWDKNIISRGGQLQNTIIDLLCIAFWIAVCWLSGYFLEVLFAYPADYWEITAFKGAIFLILASLPIGLGEDYGWWKEPFWKAPKNYLIWIFFYAFVAGLIWLLLTYVLPYLYGMF